MHLNLLAVNLLPGHAGHLLVIISFTSAALAAFSYLNGGNLRNEVQIRSWTRLGRYAFAVHGLATLSVIITLFYIINQHLFEYYYAWQHTSRALPVYFQISSFWEGQEGSFLLWMFWHIVLGAVLITTLRKWEAPVMTILSLAQFLLASMILGIYFWGYKVGSSPFILLRDAMPDAPIFRMNPDFIPNDGSGLNPLLQNYWMVIHPPVLFLGFASGIVPFCLAIAALWKRSYADWVRPALPWSLFAVMALGTGIFMGAAWAYEALSFGGYWAWDPVENASLVPWLVMIAGVHVLLAYKHSGHALKTTFMLFILAFLLILYATFLTRSGILGDTSVHSFTDLGMSGQLVFYLLAFLVIAVVLMIKRWGEIPTKKKEEATYSREFWLFIGALVFGLAAFQITFDTSRPVINTLFSTNLAPPADPIPHYNRWQLPIAIILAVLSAAVQFLRYKKTAAATFLKKLLVPFILAVAITLSGIALFDIRVWHYVLLLFAGIFAMTANTYYVARELSGKLGKAGASIAHTGFGLMLVGILISSYNKEVISLNRMGIDYGEDFDDREKHENILLYKDFPMQMGDYRVTYVGDTATPLRTYYRVRYERLEEDRTTIEETFTLQPYVQIDDNTGMVPSPDTRHYLTKDVFTHVTSVPDRNEAPEDPEYTEYTMTKGDSVFLSRGYMVLEQISPQPTHPDYTPAEGDVAAEVVIRLITLDTVFYARPVYYIRDNREYHIEDALPEQGLHFAFRKILPESSEVKVAVREKRSSNDFIIMKAIVFPFINFVWIGLIIMVIGFTLSIITRYRQNQRTVDRR